METANLVSNWSNSARSVPKSYIFPPEKRPGDFAFPIDESIPVIDLESNDQSFTIQQIYKASQDFGIFQVINHGVPDELIDKTMEVFEEFLAMPADEKVRECSNDPKKRLKLYTSSENYLAEELHYWRDALAHPCHPLEEHSQFWPQNPKGYRDVVGKYTVEVRKLASKILEMISLGLGLKPDYFSGELSENPTVLVNYYPRCPEPSLALGMAKHRDPSLITLILQEDVHGLQVFKEGNWFVVPPISHAFIVNVGYILQVISNGKLKASEHRVMTNSNLARTTASLFIYPLNDTIVEPETTLIEACNNPPLYKAFQYKHFRSFYLSHTADAQKVHNFMDVNATDCSKDHI